MRGRTVSKWHIQGSQVTLHSIVSLSVSSTRWLMFSDSSLFGRTSTAQVGLPPACVFLCILRHCLKYVALHAADCFLHSEVTSNFSYDTWWQDGQDVMCYCKCILFVCFIIHVLNIKFSVLCPVHYMYLNIIFIHVNNINFLSQVKREQLTNSCDI